MTYGSCRVTVIKPGTTVWNMTADQLGGAINSSTR
jgi:hypothetical protein